MNGCRIVEAGDMASPARLPCTVLLIGGVSGSGKTTAARQISQWCGASWLMVDDLRLALQRSRVTLPQRTDALYAFAEIDERPEVWQQSPEALCEALIATGEVLAPAIEAVIENHVDQSEPIIIEGDGILPPLLDRPALRRAARGSRVRAVFLVEPDEQALLETILTRGRAIERMPEPAICTEARAKWLFGRWVAEQAARRQLPVLAPRPWDSLPDRILRAARAGG
jgi:2-phosphoglycerate kinase